MSTIASLDVDLSLNSAKFIQGLHKARKEHEDFAKSLAEIGSKASELSESLGVHLDTNFSIAGVVEKAKEAEESQAKLNAVLRATGEAAGISAEGMKRIEEELSRVTTFSHEAVKGAETVLATFTHVRGDQFREAMKAAADLSTIFGVDLTTAAQKLGRALENPGEGLKSLAKMGVQFTESQKSVIQELVATGDIAKAQEEILKAVNAKVGGSSEDAAKTASGALKRLQNSFDETAAHIGKVILPAVTALSKGLNGIQGAASGAGAAIKAFQTVQGTLKSLDAFNAGAGAASAAGGMRLIGQAILPVAAAVAAVGTAIDAFSGAYETSQAIAAKAADREAEAHRHAAESANRHAAALEAVQEAARKAADRQHDLVAALIKESELSDHRPLWKRQEEQLGGMRFEAANRAKAGEAQNRLDETGNPVGLGRLIADIKDLEKSLATEKAKAASEELAAQRADLERRAASLHEALMTPFEHFQETVGNLKSLLAAGLLSPAEVVRGMQKAEHDLDKQSAPPHLAAAALAQGSAAAFSAALKNQRADEKSPEVDLLGRQLKEAQHAGSSLDDILKALLAIKTPNELNMN